MASVVWPDAALQQLDQIIAYINLFDPIAAERFGARLTALGESLAAFPDRGRPVADGKRELTSVPPYILRYRVSGETVLILGIRHGAQRPEQ